MADWEAQELARLAPEIDEEASRAEFDRRRTRRRRRRRSAAAVVGIGLLVLAGLSAAVMVGDDGDLPVTTGEADRSRADTLSVTCTDEGTLVDRETVAARGDGVHVRIENRTSRNLVVLARHLPREAELHLEPTGAPAGAHVVSWPPGRNLVLCSERDGHEQVLPPSDFADAPEVVVTDPGGHWTTTALDCPGLVESGGAAHGLNPDLERTDPVVPPEELARRLFRTWTTGADVVGPVGYEGQTGRFKVFRLVRDDGRAVALAEFSMVGDHWYLGLMHRCDPLG